MFLNLIKPLLAKSNLLYPKVTRAKTRRRRKNVSRSLALRVHNSNGATLSLSDRHPVITFSPLGRKSVSPLCVWTGQAALDKDFFSFLDCRRCEFRSLSFSPGSYRRLPSQPRETERYQSSKGIEDDKEGTLKRACMWTDTLCREGEWFFIHCTMWIQSWSTYVSVVPLFSSHN